MKTYCRALTRVLGVIIAGLYRDHKGILQVFIPPPYKRLPTQQKRTLNPKTLNPETLNPETLNPKTRESNFRGGAFLSHCRTTSGDESPHVSTHPRSASRWQWPCSCRLRAYDFGLHYHRVGITTHVITPPPKKNTLF